MERTEFYRSKVSLIKIALFDLERALETEKILDVEANISTMKDQFHLIEHELYRGI